MTKTRVTFVFNTNTSNTQTAHRMTTPERTPVLQNEQLVAPHANFL